MLQMPQGMHCRHLQSLWEAPSKKSLQQPCCASGLVLRNLCSSSNLSSDLLLLWAVHLFITKLSTLSNPENVSEILLLRNSICTIKKILGFRLKMWVCKLSLLVYENLSKFRGFMAIISVKNSLLHISKQPRNANWQETADQRYQTIEKERSSHFVGFFSLLETWSKYSCL